MSAGESQDHLADWLTKAEYTAGIDPEDQSDKEDENLPDLTVHVDNEGYPCLSTGFKSLMLKNQQKVVQKVFQKAYVVISSNPQAAVPWGHITQDLDHYLDMDCIPRNVVIKDPSHLQKDTISTIFLLWKLCANCNEPILRFIGYKEGDFYDSLAKKGDVSQKSRKNQKYVEVSDDEDKVLKKVPLANLSSDEEKDLAIVQKLAETQTTDSKGKARKQHLPGWSSWMWSEEYLPQNMHYDIQASFTALKKLENYIIRSHGWDMIVILGLGLLHECRCAQKYEADEAGNDIPEYLGTSILGIQVGKKIEEVITRIQAKVKAMLPDDHEKQMSVSKEVHMRCLENKRQVKERREVEQARVAAEKRAVEEAHIAKERAATLKKASGTKAGEKVKGKRPATDMNDSPMKKVKTSAPPAPPCHSARGKVPLKKYKD
ncbi:uncharacterized protein BJ212DRAFT_1298234 [Suillus subaureus]|uniref:Uncharacterized protein n=1 Tax=Suillus subaureus TaxID=48587 RepID=A0A9P7EG18_9AGAM|nr:uncharacterized protein BJ212DRAFT_1298234 [Suillus subaureus]KAG1819827.1 hypothetical protein BJ212DRAFT_1298234 [Suillus subaureus]